MKESLDKSDWLAALRCQAEVWYALRTAHSAPNEAGLFRMQQGQEVGCCFSHLWVWSPGQARSRRAAGPSPRAVCRHSPMGLRAVFRSLRPLSLTASYRYPHHHDSGGSPRESVFHAGLASSCVLEPHYSANVFRRLISQRAAFTPDPLNFNPESAIHALTHVSVVAQISPLLWSPHL